MIFMSIFEKLKEMAVVAIREATEFDLLAGYLTDKNKTIEEKCMENYIVINGKKAELTEDQMKALGIEVKKSPFSRVGKGEIHYLISCSGGVVGNTDQKDAVDNACFETANYCTDEALMKQRAMHETLSRLLWRFSMENDGDKINWGNVGTFKWSIYRDGKRADYSPEANQFCKHENTTYFHTKEIAQRAIDEIVKPFVEANPDFVW